MTKRNKNRTNRSLITPLISLTPLWNLSLHPSNWTISKQNVIIWNSASTVILIGYQIEFEWYIAVDALRKACMTCIQSAIRVYRMSILLDDQFLDSNWMIFEDKLIFHSCYSLAPSSPRNSSFWNCLRKKDEEAPIRRFGFGAERKRTGLKTDRNTH